MPVPPGRYRYRLVVDGTWKRDQYNTYVESNPYGELNNVVESDTDAHATSADTAGNRLVETPARADRAAAGVLRSAD